MCRKMDMEKSIGALADAVSSGGDWKDALWECIRLHQGYPYMTNGRGKDHAGAVSFRYSLKVSSRTGEVTDEMVIDRKEESKTITRSSVELAMSTAMELMKTEGYVSGPKKLKVFGASYLYAIFLDWGIIRAEKPQEHIRKDDS